MAFRDLIPWPKNQLPVNRRNDTDPFLTLHREMNRLFDDVFRGFDVASPDRLLEGRFAWPSIEVSQTDKDVRIGAELPGLSEKDVEVEIVNGVLIIRGEKRSESTDDSKLFTERCYGRFERQIPLDGVQEDQAKADFRNGVLTVTVPKSEQARSNVKQIAITSH